MKPIYVLLLIPIALLLLAQSASDNLSLLKSKAQSGDPAALNQLGCAYYQGQGVDKNLEEAIANFTKAADKEYAPALYNLAIINWNNGFLHSATSKLNAAAELGLPEAMLALGSCYFNGIGYPQNHARAYFWLSLGTAYANKQARDKYIPARDDLLHTLLRQEISDLQKESASWSASHSAAIAKFSTQDSALPLIPAPLEFISTPATDSEVNQDIEYYIVPDYQPAPSDTTEPAWKISVRHINLKTLTKPCHAFLR